MHIKIEGEQRLSLPPIFATLDEYVSKNTKEKTVPLLDFFVDTISEESKVLEGRFRKYLEAGLATDAVQQKEADNFLMVLVEERERKKIFESSPAKMF